MSAIIQKAKGQLNKMARKKHLECLLETDVQEHCFIHADAVLMEELMSQSNQSIVLWYEAMPTLPAKVNLNVKKDEDKVKVTFQLYGITMDEAHAHTLFYPESGNLHLLVAKQILREIDDLNNFPGLRLVAEPKENGTDIWFTLK